MKTIFCSLFLIFVLSVSAVNAADDWIQQNPSPKPSGRTNPAMAYIGGNKALLFGGSTASGINDETWVWDENDNTWTQKSPSPKPSARHMHKMAYIGEDKVLLFGGIDAPFTVDNETWVYDLSENTWTQKNPDPKPPGLEYHDMAYIGEDKVVLFGGAGWSGPRLNDTWVYDLSENTWTQKNPSIKPSTRVRHAMAYIGGDKVLMFGGFDGTLDDETWVYDLSENIWTQKNPPSKPSARDNHHMAYIGGNKVLLYGVIRDTWVYDLGNNIWAQDENTNQPSASAYYALSETSMNGSSYLVLFGGSGSLDETWTFGGGDYPLPVELSSFTATTSGDNVILKWRTESEVNNLGFDIYRSDAKDGKYTKVNARLIPGAGTDATPHDYSFTDENVILGKTYYYYIEDVDFSGETNKSYIIEVTVGKQSIKIYPVPLRFALLQNYPNPFNPETWFPYELAKEATVTIRIYDVNGQLVRQLDLGKQKAGRYLDKQKAAYWNGKGRTGEAVSSGLYFYTLKAGDFQETRRMLIVK